MTDLADIEDADIARIKKLAEEVVSERFGDEAKILSVSVSEDIDFDGDGILLLRIVYASETGKLNANKVSGLIRHLRPKLHEISEDRFPIISFISQMEAESEAA